MSEDKKAMIVGIPVIFIGLLCLVYFNIKDNQDFIDNCKTKGGTIIQQNYPKRLYCGLGSNSDVED